MTKGYYVETYGGGRYTSVAWYARENDAIAHLNKILLAGSWQGMMPRVTHG